MLKKTVDDIQRKRAIQLNSLDEGERLRTRDDILKNAKEQLDNMTREMGRQIVNKSGVFS